MGFLYHLVNQCIVKKVNGVLNNNVVDGSSSPRRSLKGMLCLFVLLASLGLAPKGMYAQGVETIKKSGEYLYGEGFGESIRQAQTQAMQNLVEKISVSVESLFENVEEEMQNNGSMDASSAVKLVVKTYSSATLTNTEELVLSQEPDAKVIRFVLKKDVQKIFEGRKNKVMDFINLAQSAESKLKIDDMLRYYYWAYCLLRSLPDANQVTLPGSSMLLETWIPDQINAVFANIKVRKQGVEDEFVTLFVTYKGSPVASLDYTYFDGRSYTNIYSAADGRGVMEMQPGVSTDNLKIKCEYEYSGEAQIDKEIAAVVEVMKGRNFRSAYINVEGDGAPSLSKRPWGGSEVATTNNGRSTNDIPIATVSASEAASYEAIMSKVIAAIKSKNYASVDSYFTPEGKEMFTKLLHYGNARIIEEPQLNYIQNGDEVVCRSIPMSFGFKNNTRKFVENVCFTFNSSHKINCVAFGLGEEAVSDILKHDDYTEKARVVLTQFLENYKTAFALKRLEYIKSIFDDNALIITGSVVKRTDYKSKEEKTRFLDNKIIRYNRQTKNEYIKNLERCFNSNEFVNIHFANNDIVKAGGSYGEVYGIQIRQDYYSTNYGDTGYLFLFVDLNDPNNPIIKVRTWQPDRDPDFGLYGLGDF